ncbi:MAG: sensor domain-containing diguanylate cyclase [Gallionella sp.]|nr:sensor domain-containing diguanylate cyclase [Gallionella sp.]
MEQMPVVLSEYFSVLEDTTQTLTLADVQKPEVAARFNTDQAPASALNYGLTGSAYWLRLTLSNTSDQPLERMLEVAYPILTSIQFHYADAQGGYRTVDTGNALPFATRAYKNRAYVFPVTLPARSGQVVYLRLQSTTPIIVPANLWEPQAFHTHERNDYIAQSWYFGMATAMILFNLLLFIALRDAIYLFYVNFAFCTALAFSSEYGLAKEFLWPGATHWAIISTGILLSLSVAAGIAFMRRMLDTVKLIPKLDKLLKALTYLFLIIPFSLVLSIETFIRPAVSLIVATILLIFSVGLYCSFKRQRSAILFTIAFAILLAGAAAMVLRGLGYLPTNGFTAYGVQLGSAIEMLLLAFALADRFNVMRREKAKAQEEALKAQQHLVEHLQSHERILEDRVAERTGELEILNRKLEALSTTDGLTGIANRRRFDQVLESEWNRAARSGQPLALALIDVDWFKKFNDHYGHQAGDDCLRHVADVLAASVCRTSDLVARYGGEEFAFIAPATDADSALTMARKICEALHARGLPHEKSDFGCLSASIGVAVMIPKETDKADVLLKAADAALYRAKEQGRNKAVLAE